MYVYVLSLRMTTEYIMKSREKPTKLMIASNFNACVVDTELYRRRKCLIFPF